MNHRPLALYPAVDTPAAVVDLDRLERNIGRHQAYLDAHGIAGWPHIKTHKIPRIAQMQLDRGARGITCQKLGEAEVFAAAGFADIFLPYNIVGPAKLERLRALAGSVNVRVTADSAVVVDGLSRAFHDAGQPLPVLVEFDGGLGRCGVQSPEAAAALAEMIARAPGLVFGGLMTYPLNEHTAGFVAAARALLAARGTSLECISAGGTPGMWDIHRLTRTVASESPWLTEYRAGTYVYGDRRTVQLGAMSLENCAFVIAATVVSCPAPGRAILDAGSKALTSDTLGLDGYGLILEYPDARIYALSEEHGHVDVAACNPGPAVGEQVHIVPNHCCTANNLYDEVVVMRRGVIEGVWPVAARGTVR